MKSKKYLLFLFLLISSISFANNSLRIIDPQGSWWNNYSPTIKNAELAVKPVGGFIENDLTLEIGLDAPFSQNDLKLEIILDFSLPENSMITDSWLWINGVPKQSEIMDRWTASNIYEEIVNRRKDPSLLIKNGNNQYTINIYPLNPNETRKFRITYLTPIEYAGNMIYCQYPTGILKTTTTSLSKLSILAIPNNKFTSPSILYGSTSFSSFNSTEFGSCYKAQITNAEFGKAQIAFTNTNTNPLKVYQYKEGGYYQLSFTPSEVFNIESSSNKICYLIDFDENYLGISKNDLLSILKNNLTGNYSKKDSFNIIFSNLSLTPVFENWKPITAQNLNEAFNSPTLSNYSNLIPLLAKGITYINNSGGKGKIVLLSNNAIFQGVDNSNNILKDINNLNTNNSPVDVINYMDNYYTSNWIGNSYYYGNSYLYTNIARTNSGQYLSFYDQTGNSNFSELLRNCLISVSNQAINNVDVYTNLDDGYCYGRMNYNSSGFQNYSMNTPINQIGRFNGNFPISVEIAAELNKQTIHQKITIKESDCISTDSTLKTAWNGFDILQLESENPNSQIINEIISESMDNRVLSLYTAFLCLEDTVTVCENCGEEGTNITGNADIKNKGIKAFPNPFSNSIQIQLEESDHLQKIEIYNVMGQKVKELEVQSGCDIYTWDGKDEQNINQKPGIFLVVARYDNKIISLKIWKI